MLEGITAMSDLLLQVVAIRLAGLVLAGLMLRALPEPPHAPSAAPIAALQRQAATPAPDAHIDPAIALALRDMRLHD
jgi:hypothetical protein